MNRHRRVFNDWKQGNRCGCRRTRRRDQARFGWNCLGNFWKSEFETYIVWKFGIESLKKSAENVHWKFVGENEKAAAEPNIRTLIDD